MTATWDEARRVQHGRWIGLFKLAEECGELAIAAADLNELGPGVTEATGPYLRALENKLADVGAAAQHVAEVNGLDLQRVGARRGRRSLQLGGGLDVHHGRIGLMNLVRACGTMNQLLGKICAFPEGTEHPDGHGNLVGRLEVAIADLTAACTVVAARNDLNLDHIELRGDDKAALFRIWFPAPGQVEEPA